MREGRVRIQKAMAGGNNLSLTDRWISDAIRLRLHLSNIESIWSSFSYLYPSRAVYKLL